MLKEIVASYRIADIILTESGEVSPHARVLANGRSFQFVGDLDAKLREGDTIALIYSWIGHEDF
jgi:molybdopterin converting factor small subunit